MAETLRIRLRKKDGILISWRNAVFAKSDRGLLSFLFKKAVIHYIKTGDTICIGKVFLPDGLVMEKEISLNVFIGDSPEIIDLVSRNAKDALKLLRDILKQSIQIVETMEEQWIPSYLDIEKMERANHITIPAKMPSPTPAAAVSQQEAKDSAKASTSLPQHHKKKSGASLKASALFGKD